MNIRRVRLEVDKAIQRPSRQAVTSGWSLPRSFSFRGAHEMIDIATAIDAARGVAGLYITLTPTDGQTVRMDITVEGDNIDIDGLFLAIECTGAAVHSIDELAAGDRLVERIARKR